MKHMKKSFALGIILLLVAVLTSGCTDQTVIPEKGDFSFSLPEGYSIGNITDTKCEIVQEDSGAAIGGFEITELKLKDLKDTDTKNIMRYLQSSFHKTNRVEFIAMNFRDPRPIVSVSLSAYYENHSKGEYVHYFFEKQQGVYHMWFDLDVAEEGIQLDFMPILQEDL